MKYFKVFESTCYILRDRENLGKFDSKSDEGIFLGYSTRSKAYRVFNKRTSSMKESINVIINDQSKTQVNKEEGELPDPQEEPKDVPSHDSGNESEETNDDDVSHLKEKRLVKGHSSKDIIGDPKEGVKTRKQIENTISHICFTSKIEPRKVKEALNDPDWILAM